VLHAVSKEALARKTPVNETMLYIQRALAKRYPGHVAEDQEWMFNIAGERRLAATVSFPLRRHQVVPWVA
jgi:hypothetical protein